MRPVNGIGLPFRDVVVVADLFDLSDSSLPIHLRRDLERTDPATLRTLVRAIEALGLSVVHYSGPERLAENGHRHRDDLVLSIYGGTASRNRMALVPAICETFGIPFIGPDAYGRIICQDKPYAKGIAERIGFHTPSFVVVNSAEELDALNNITIPYVLKPVAEGSSIGMSCKNVIRTRNKGRHVAKELLSYFQQPIMAESFVPGREVSFNVVISDDGFHLAFSEIVMESDNNFFDDHIFDAPEKLLRPQARRVDNIDHLVTDNDKLRVRDLIRAVGKVDYCRVDGKYCNSKFVFLELTPDAWIDPQGAFAASFIAKGWSYEELILRILSSPQWQLELHRRPRPPSRLPHRNILPFYRDYANAKHNLSQS